MGFQERSDALVVIGVRAWCDEQGLLNGNREKTCVALVEAALNADRSRLRTDTAIRQSRLPMYDLFARSSSGHARRARYLLELLEGIGTAGN